jgi:putative transcriptional regulator
MNQVTYLNNQFIVAMPALADPNFFHTVTYLCQHNEEGALGLIINRPAEMKFGEICEQMHISYNSDTLDKIPVFMGGPVQPGRGFVLHTAGREWEVTMAVSETISLTTSRDIIEAIATDQGPEQYLVALGYAGWGVGQLEQEMLDNTWLHTPSGNHIIFDTPIDKRWQAAGGLLGIDINQLTTPAGHG